MNELLQLLDGSIEDVRAGLAGKSREELTVLRQAETDGKSRKGVLDLLDGAIRADETDQAERDIDISHPSIDVDPRAGTTAVQNLIDFNDPTISGQEAVLKNLARIESASADKDA